jgi:hypothetical protein
LRRGRIGFDADVAPQFYVLYAAVPAASHTELNGAASVGLHLRVQLRGSLAFAVGFDGTFVFGRLHVQTADGKLLGTVEPATIGLTLGFAWSPR